LINDQTLLAAIDEGRENSYGTDEQSTLGQKRAQAIEAYLGLNTNPAPEGRSQVVDRTVFQTISTILPSLIRIYANSSETICKCEPVGPDDEKGAEQATAILNHFVTQLNPWEQIAGDWIHDASLLCNGYAMAYWKETDETIEERYEGQSDDQLAALMQAPDVTITQADTSVDEEATQEAMRAYEQMLQQVPPEAATQGFQPPPPPQPVMRHDVVLERRLDTGKPCIEVLPPEHCTVSTRTPSWMLTDCPFFEFRQRQTIADLRAMGLDVPEDISDSEDASDSDEDFARDRFGESSAIDTDSGKGVMREVWARMTWVRAAGDDGKARLWYCLVVGRTILFKEPVSRIHASSMTPQPLPHRHIGMSLAETVKSTQDIKTAIKRGGLDNLYLANNGRHAISDKVNVSDFLDARPGGVVRLFAGAMPGDGHIMPLVHPVMFDQVIGSLEYFDQDAQNLSGASRYFSGTDAGAINKTASGTMALQNMAAMRVEHIARVMAPAVEHLFSIVQELIAKHQNKAMTIKLRGEWVTVDPQAWRTKRDVKISVGVGAGNKESMRGELQQILGAQMQVGLPLGLVTREHIHATNVEIAKLAGFANPAKFWPDPKQLPPPQPQPTPEQVKAQADAQKTQFQAQQDAQKFQAEQALERERMQYQAQLDAQREEMQARQKTLEQQLNAQVKQIELDAKERIEQQKLDFQRWQTEFQGALQIALADKSAASSLEQTEAAKTPDKGTSDTVAELKEALRAMQEEAAMPAELVRDPQSGRALAVRRGGKERKVIRGPDGRAIGVQ
jgi:hypothetical protein